MDATKLLRTFCDAVEQRNGKVLAELFTEDGVYHDVFYGAFEGVAIMTLRDGKISTYHEVANTASAFVDLNFAPERIAKIVAKQGAALAGLKWVDFPNQGQVTQWVQGLNQAIAQKVDAILLSSNGDAVAAEMNRYQQVLCSALWWERRAEIIEVRGAMCERCGIDGEELELHHMTYQNLGDESDSDLELLCVGCHGRAHGWW